MSLNQWKLLHQLKETISKISNDEPIQNTVRKNAKELLQKLSSHNEISKYLDAPNKKAPELLKSTVNGAPKWKHTKLISKNAVSSQTEHTMIDLEMAENEEALLNRIESLIVHIKQYPEGRNAAIRAGAIRILLRHYKSSKNEAVTAATRQALSMLGYADPVPQNGIRILSMDGGGIRGLLVLEMLKKLEELTGRRTYELFDLICGVSTGAIIAFAIGVHRRDLDDIAVRYKDIAFEVFNTSPLWGTSSLVWSQAYYDTSLWERKLSEHLGTMVLSETARDANCPKMCAVSAVVNQSHLSAYVFRNYSLPWQVKSQYFGGGDVEIWKAARASAAAPTYFEEFKLGNYLHQDGGILVNNPTAVALHEAKLIWPNTPIQCIVSFGTGRTVPTHNDLSIPYGGETANNTSWANKFSKILDSATDTEGVHITLNDLLPFNKYYRFNPYLTEMISMVEIDTRKLDQLERDVLMYLRRNEDKFQDAARVLTTEKTWGRKCRDFIQFKRDLYGL